MRILIHDYAGHAFQTALSRELARRGHEVAHLFASDLQTPRGDLKVRDHDPAGLAFHEIPMDPDYPRYKYSFLRRRSMEIGYGRRAADFIRAWKPDAVLSGNTPTETQEEITRAAIESGARFYYWLQDFYSLAVDKLLRKKIPVVGHAVGAWYRFLEGRQFRRSSQVVAITGDFGPILQHEFGVAAERVAVVPNWAIIEEMPVHPKDNNWARRHGLHDKFVYLYSGTIGMKHNPGLLLELARRFSNDPNVRVVIVSEGIGAEWLRKEAGDSLKNLLLLPYQPFAELPQVLASGDVLISILEPDAGIFSVPSKTLSYLCAGRPLLLAVPRENLAARITREEGAGVTVEPGDLDGFISAAANLLTDTARREETGRNARAYAEKTFSIGPTADKFEHILANQG
ncbi:glycosyltransferase family 4 protein [Luteolibacter ambystomatis]|uniref:Glycosyltransferase family 4 protein n=1 Tax=Luteolibacter ambystomatis TaxID=2824561 RepID=A0A975G6D6_9BACT|nr:glycosyltransferase family 4 protein [Luteolibacter ambystomatis]QUE49601.1 glycosyltransferase family 4 protein [Luteolibacter ambystomatis]